MLGGPAPVRCQERPVDARLLAPACGCELLAHVSGLSCCSGAPHTTGDNLDDGDDSGLAGSAGANCREGLPRAPACTAGGAPADEAPAVAASPADGEPSARASACPSPLGELRGTNAPSHGVHRASGGGPRCSCGAPPGGGGGGGGGGGEATASAGCAAAHAARYAAALPLSEVTYERNGWPGSSGRGAADEELERLSRPVEATRPSRDIGATGGAFSRCRMAGIEADDARGGSGAHAGCCDGRVRWTPRVAAVDGSGLPRCTGCA